jgi:2-methylcitrate dehydratase
MSIPVDGANQVFLPKNSNQAKGIAEFAISMCRPTKDSKQAGPSQAVYDRVTLFHTDAVLCGLSALALNTNAPNVLRDEALEIEVKNGGVHVFGSDKLLVPEKAIAANCSAVREWDSNGTVFGYNAKLGKKFQAGEFGHNDFYGVCVAACQLQGLDGKTALKAMICLDEIRGRLSEVFSLKTYKIDHVVHGAIASAAVYGALMGATAEQIESAIGMFVAHYVPWRAIRAGKQLSDSKGASAALSTEAALLCMRRAMKGFVGPADIFRNPESLFRQFEPTEADALQEDTSPFDLVLTHSGDDFAVMGMHFKLGLYEHQSAGAIQGMMTLLDQHPEMLKDGAASIKSMEITAYEPAFGIIGNPEKWNPTTRQSADHSMVYILSILLHKAFTMGDAVPKNDNDAVWKALILTPADYSKDMLVNSDVRALMNKMSFKHGGQEYDEK